MIPYAYRTDTAFHPPVPHVRDSGLLDVGDGHRIFWEEIGPADGAPVVVLHGGPGGFAKPYYRRLLDPARHRGVLFDQRGCGRSTPFGALEHNTTDDLVADIERLRVARGIDRWVVLGGSWGSCLAVAYAERHPERVRALLVTGVFLARAEEIDWLWTGCRVVFPDIVAARDSLLPEHERGFAREAFLSRMLSDDPTVSRPAILVSGAMGGELLDLMPQAPPDDPFAVDEKDIASARITAHYDRNRYFLRENQLLADAGRLAKIPGAIVNGRSDMCTPPLAAWDLSQAWPGARLSVAAAAGHRWNDEALGRVLLPELARLAAETAP